MFISTVRTVKVNDRRNSWHCGRMVGREDCSLHSLFYHLYPGSIRLDPTLWSVPAPCFCTTYLSCMLQLVSLIYMCLSELYFQEKLRKQLGAG
jgi:hypothetical protein